MLLEIIIGHLPVHDLPDPILEGKLNPSDFACQILLCMLIHLCSQNIMF